MAIGKRIAYKDGSNKPEENSAYDPLFGAEGENLIVFPRDRIKPWWEEEETKAPEAPEGIMRVASARGDREYLITVLSQFFTPRDLYYKTTKELSKLLEMQINGQGGVI